MEEGDWPVTIIEADFLLSGIACTSSKISMTEQLGVCNLATGNAVPCADSLTTENCSSLKDPFDSLVGSSDYFCSEGNSPCSSFFFSEPSLESPKLSNLLHNQNSLYHHMETNTCTTKSQFNFNRYKNKLTFEAVKNKSTNLQLFKNVAGIDSIHSTELKLKTDETGVINNSTPSPTFGSTLMQHDYYQYSPSLLHDSFVPSSVNSVSANYYQYNTGTTQNQQILSCKSFNGNLNSTVERLVNDEEKQQIVKNEIYMNEFEGYHRFNSEKLNNTHNIINQKRDGRSLKESNPEHYFSNEIDIDEYNTENDNKQFFERPNVTISPACYSSAVEYFDEFGTTLTETPEELRSTSSSTSSSSIRTRLKNREKIIQEKKILPSPTKTRSKMHDLAVKHRLITNQNTRAHGTIQLSTEEKRTLLQEGYCLPTHLPLTRKEEEALKIVRRKIKNKLSAQESRRKRKEYIDNLEKKVHSFYNDNAQLRNRIKQLELLNRDLLTQLEKIQQ